jgi:putative Holliday junction resolvase
VRAPGRALGIDAGEVRVGVAISDDDGIVASPLLTLPAGEGLPGRVAEVAREHRCTTVVVGLPKGLSNRDTASTQLARTLAEAIEAQGLEVALWDERLSSAEAERMLIGAGRRREQRREERDRIAASIILQGWLDAQRTARGGNPA